MTDTIQVAFVGKLKHARLYRFLRERGWTQSELARQLGVHPTVVGRWMQLTDYPRKPEVQQRLMELTGESIFDLFPEIMRHDEFFQTVRRLPKEFVLEREMSVQALREAAHRRALPTPEQVVGAVEKEQALQQLLETLSPREQRIVRRRFGLDGDAPQTIREVAAGFGVGCERIRQMEAQAMRKLREYVEETPECPIVEVLKPGDSR